MSDQPEHWTPNYQGDKERVQQLKHYSYSDRIRYYWRVPSVKSALDKLFENQGTKKIPETIVSYYFSGREFGDLTSDANTLASDHIALCIDRYYKACGYD